MTQTPEQLMPLPALPPGGTTGNQIQSNPNRNSFLQGASLDFKLATLRNEMVTLRQLDMKLLCQLWALNESLQDYKKTLEDDEHQREVTSILESHLEEEEDELTANDNDESCWQDEEQGNDQGQLLEADEEDYSVPVNSRPGSLPSLPPGLGGAPLGRLIIGGLNGGSPTNGAASPGSAHSAHSAASAAAVAAAAASNDPTAAARRRLPNRPQMPIFPQGQRALPGTNHIYGNIMPPQLQQQQSPSPRLQSPISPYISNAPSPATVAPPIPAGHPRPRLVTPNSAFLTNLANKRIMNNANNMKR